MEDRVSKDLVRIFSIWAFVCLLHPIILNAAKKPTKKQLALWEQIEKNANINNAETTVQLCKTFIGNSEMFDSLSCLSRSLLAEYYLATEDLYSVYDCYVFFREYSKQANHQVYAESYRDELISHYQKLLAKELQVENYEGVWFSDLQGDANQPFIAFALKSNVNGEACIKIWEGCQFYKEFSKYKANEETSIDKASLILEKTVTDSIKLKYIAQWGDQRIKEAKNNTAITLQKMSNTVRTETSRAIASAPDGNLGEILAVQAVSSLLQATFETFADLLSNSSVKSFAATLNFGSISNGEMPAELSIDTQTIRTGSSPITGNRIIKFNLYKWYPHDEITFMTDYYSMDQLIRPSDEDKGIVKYNRSVSPLIYKNGNKNMRKPPLMGKKKFNKQMYIDFARERVFWPMYNDTTKHLIPLQEDMNYFSYSGNVTLVGWDAKNKREDSYKAEKKADGTITFYQMAGSKPSGLRSGYYPNGEHHVCKVYDNVKQGKYIIYDDDGNLLGYNFYADGKKEGKSRWRVKNGWLEKQWNEDVKQGTSKIIFDNGDLYEGDTNEAGPNGRGIMTFANGKKLSGEWKEGKYVSTVSERKKGVTQRKRRR